MNNLVSIIIPTYKGASQLSRAIDSALGQTYQLIEIIIVDDNPPESQDRQLTEGVVNQYTHSKIRYIKHKENLNGAAARNTGLDYSKGNYVCFLDDDDFYLPDRVQESVNLLTENSTFGAVYSGVALADRNTIYKMIKANEELTHKKVLLDDMAIGTGSNLFVKKEVIQKVGRFDEKFERYQDLEYILRILDVSRVVNLNKVLIVKASNGTDNIPAYKKLKTATELYLQKFEYLIEKLTEDEKKQVYTAHYSRLLYHAIQTENKGAIIEGAEDLKKYKQLKGKDRVVTFMRQYNIGIKAINLVKAMRRERNRNIPENSIDPEVKSYLEEYFRS